MKVLIACEYSGVSRRAFEALGHEVISADFEPAEDGAKSHCQGLGRAMGKPVTVSP